MSKSNKPLGSTNVPTIKLDLIAKNHQFKGQNGRKRETHNLSARRRAGIYFSKVLRFSKICFFIATITFSLLYYNKIKQNFIDKFHDFSQFLGFKVENIIIQDKINSNPEDILSIVGIIKNSPIFSVDINAIKDRLQSYSWVREAVVLRKLPNTIQIKLVEKIPVAIWQKNQKLSIVDADGNVITSDNVEKFSSLLHVVGDDANIYADNLIKSIPQNFIHNIDSAVRFGNRRWNLILKNNITVKMPEESFDQAIKYVIQLNDEGKFFNSDIKSLDLRNPKKYYIEYIKKQN